MEVPVARMQTANRRVESIDLARGIALLAMVIYHFTWDLEFFGYVEPGLTAVGGWRLFARAIASSFLFLVGVSLVLGHGSVFRPGRFMQRFRQIAAAAILISVVTWFAFPEGFIFFGILHEIAFASVVGLFFIRLPAFVTLAAAIAVIALPHFFRHEFFDSPILWWVGLSTVIPRSNDYVPVFPWLGAVLCGVAAGRLAVDHGLIERLRPIRFEGWSRPLQFAGQHGLAFYLIHQPVLIGCLFLFSLMVPAPGVAPSPETFAANCHQQCAASRDEAFCLRYCECALQRVQQDGQLAALFSREPDAQTQAYIQGVAEVCTAETELQGGR